MLQENDLVAKSKKLETIKKELMSRTKRSVFDKLLDVVLYPLLRVYEIEFMNDVESYAEQHGLSVKVERPFYSLYDGEMLVGFGKIGSRMLAIIDDRYTPKLV